MARQKNNAPQRPQNQTPDDKEIPHPQYPADHQGDSIHPEHLQVHHHRGTALYDPSHRVQPLSPDRRPGGNAVQLHIGPPQKHHHRRGKLHSKPHHHHHHPGDYPLCGAGAEILRHPDRAGKAGSPRFLRGLGPADLQHPAGAPLRFHRYGDLPLSARFGLDYLPGGLGVRGHHLLPGLHVGHWECRGGAGDHLYAAFQDRRPDQDTGHYRVCGGEIPHRDPDQDPQERVHHLSEHDDSQFQHHQLQHFL